MLHSIRQLDYVILLCHDIPRMKHFYHTILGFPIHLEIDGWLELRIGSILLTLSTRERPFVGPPVPEQSASVQLAFRVPPTDMQRCYEELQAHHVEILQAPQMLDKRAWKYWMHRTLFFKDPEGNLLEIYAEIDRPEDTAHAHNSPAIT